MRSERDADLIDDTSIYTGEWKTEKGKIVGKFLSAAKVFCVRFVCARALQTSNRWTNANASIHSPYAIFFPRSCLVGSVMRMMMVLPHFYQFVIMFGLLFCGFPNALVCTTAVTAAAMGSIYETIECEEENV